MKVSLSKRLERGQLDVSAVLTLGLRGGGAEDRVSLFTRERAKLPSRP